MNQKMWTVTTTHGVVYEIGEFEYVKYKNIHSLSAVYWYRGRELGVGAFPIDEIAKLERISLDNRVV